MIRINLLNVERKAPKKFGASFQVGQKITIGCSLILIVAALFVGWRYRTLHQESARLDNEIVTAQQETTRLRSILQQVQQFDQRKTQLQERVVLIEELRKSQTGPVHMLDQISRALPPMVWLTQLKQTDEGVTIEGKCAALTSLSDFIVSLEASGYFKRSIEIVSSQAEATATPAAGELIKFSIKAQFQQPGEAGSKQ
jgi:type IV pilus assembly protein PilN